MTPSRSWTEGRARKASGQAEQWANSMPNAQWDAGAQSHSTRSYPWSCAGENTATQRQPSAEGVQNWRSDGSSWGRAQDSSWYPGQERWMYKVRSSQASCDKQRHEGESSGSDNAQITEHACMSSEHACVSSTVVQTSVVDVTPCKGEHGSFDAWGVWG